MTNQQIAEQNARRQRRVFWEIPEFEPPKEYRTEIEKEDGKLTYVAHCAACPADSQTIERGPNGSWVETAGRMHTEQTGHTVIIGYRVHHNGLV